MASPGFGFSAGDFIGAIGLITTICKALKDAGGASSEYQHVILELHSLENVLTQLASLEPTDGEVNHVNAIRGMALACQLPLREFLTKLQKYEASLGPFAVGRGPVVAARKAKWAVYMVEEIAKLRGVVQGKVISISLLLAAHNSRTVLQLQRRSKENHRQLMFSATTHENRLHNTQRRVEEIKEVVADVGRDMKDKFRSLEESANESTSRLQSICSASNSIRSSVVSLRHSGENLLQFIHSFSSEFRDTVQKIHQTNLQIYNLLLAQGVPQIPSRLQQNDITFVNALGMVDMLPYNHFRHWEMFETYLRLNFEEKTLPGKAKVLEGQYYIMDTKKSGALITKEDWQQSIFPGPSISMSMIISHIRRESNRCPRPRCGGTNILKKGGTQKMTCSDCDLNFFSPVDDSNLDEDFRRKAILDEEDEVTKQQREEDSLIFGQRPRASDAVIEPDSMKFEFEEEHGAVSSTTQNKDFGEEEGPDRPLKEKKMDFVPIHPISTQLPQIDWEGGKTPIEAWLNHCAAPPPQALSLETEKQENEIKERFAREQEMQEIEVFRNVHIEESSVEKTCLIQSINQPNSEERLEFGARIYYRNIRDRFPQIPEYLARRLAEANRVRAERLTTMKLENELKMKERSCVQCTWSNLECLASDDGITCSRCFARKIKCLSNYVNEDHQLSLIRNSGKNLWLRSAPVFPGTAMWNPLTDSANDQTDFWSGRGSGSTKSRPTSRHSSMNSSLRGDSPGFDPTEQSAVTALDQWESPEKERESQGKKWPRREVPCKQESWEPPEKESSSGTLGAMDNYYETPSPPLFELPPPPVSLSEKQVFGCDICGATVRICRRRDWKNHVLNDVRPYICTFKSCEQIVHFGSQSEFLDHELQYHRDFREMCTRCGSRKIKKATVKGWGVCSICQELRKIHTVLENPSLCPFCAVRLPINVAQMARHLARHLEEISFAVVSKPYEEWKFYDSASSEG